MENYCILLEVSCFLASPCFLCRYTDFCASGAIVPSSGSRFHQKRVYSLVGVPDVTCFITLALVLLEPRSVPSERFLLL